jgi:hypothetical protein
MDPFMIDLFGFLFLFLVQFLGIHSDVFVKLLLEPSMIQPNEATGQVSILTYKINSAIVPILLIVPSIYIKPPK